MMGTYQTPIVGLQSTDFTVTKEDFTELSENFFRVKDLPNIATIGYNSFKINPNFEFIDENRQLKVFAYDSLGNPVEIFFPEVDFGNDDRLISFVIEDSTSLGFIDINLLGELKEGGWVLWKKQLKVDKTSYNLSPIIYEETPVITHSEIQKQKRRESFVEGGTSLLQITQSNYLPGGDDIINNPGSSVFLDVRANGNTFLHASGFNFSPNMVEGKVTLTIPDKSLPLYEKYYKLEQGNKITVKILQFLTNKALRIESVTQGIVGLEDSHKFFSFDNADYSIEYNKEIRLVDTQGTQTYLLLEILKAQPVSGQAYYLETSYKHIGATDSSLIDKQVITPSEFLIDSSSLSFEKTIGTFTSASILDRYWETGTVGVDTVKVSKKWDEIDDTFRTSEIILQKGYSIFKNLPLTFDTNSPIGPAAVIGTDDGDYSGENSYITFMPTLLNYKNSDTDWKISAFIKKYVPFSQYEIELTAYGVKNLGSGYKDPVMELYMVGESFTSREPIVTNTSAGTVTGRLISQLKHSEDAFLYENQKYIFTVGKETQGYPLFVVKYGTWYISKISIKPAVRNGQTANHTYVYVPIPDNLLYTSVDIQFDILNKASVGIDYLPEEGG